ncbi:MAG: hypothetical protein QOG10_1564 [Kribbellaceae bacterium]|nr:hypothetical protein [Kribbellaceae bacterium]
MAYHGRDKALRVRVVTRDAGSQPERGVLPRGQAGGSS